MTRTVNVFQFISIKLPLHSIQMNESAHPSLCLFRPTPFSFFSSWHIGSKKNHSKWLSVVFALLSSCCSRWHGIELLHLTKVSRVFVAHSPQYGWIRRPVSSPSKGIGFFYSLGLHQFVFQFLQAYAQTIETMNRLYNEVHLVHADLSEYNILWHEGQCW